MAIKPAMDNITVHTDCLFDPKKKSFVHDVSLVVSRQSGLIVEVINRVAPLDNNNIKPNDIDLRGKCVLPGLVDAHTHIFLHAYKDTPSLYQMRDESLEERVIRATNHCRLALLAGYTTYRDLGTESLGNSDVHVRDAINRGIIPGPRIYCATECLASSGGYEIRIENAAGGATAPRICDPCDGPIGCRAGVRRRIGAGADIVKFYADYRKRTLRFPDPTWPGCPGIMFPPQSGWGSDVDQRNPNRLLFQQDEMDAMVAEARSARAPVAAHAATAEGVTLAARAGVTTIEHGFEAIEHREPIEAMVEHGTIFVPTLAVAEVFVGEDIMKQLFARVKDCFDAGVRLAAGGDTGAFPHGENAREMELLLDADVPLEEVLTAATLHGWEACGGDWCGRRFGWFESGCAADIIALDSDPRKDDGALRKVGFVMKDARVWKRDAVAVGMV